MSRGQNLGVPDQDRLCSWVAEVEELILDALCFGGVGSGYTQGCRTGRMSVLRANELRYVFSTVLRNDSLMFGPRLTKLLRWA